MTAGVLHSQVPLFKWAMETCPKTSNPPIGSGTGTM